MSKVNYAIEILTDKVKPANLEYGFDGSTFRWITGRPGYQSKINYADFVLSKTPTHYWRFNEASGSIIDLGSNPVNLDATEGFTYGVTGPTEINDTTLAGYGGASCMSPLNMATDKSGEFMIDGWIKIDDVSTNYRLLFSIKDHTYQPIKTYFEIYKNAFNGQLEFDLYDPDNNIQTSFLTTFRAVSGEWFYFAFAYDEGISALYINGELVDTLDNQNFVSLFSNAAWVYFNPSGMSYSNFSMTKSAWITGMLIEDDWYNHLVKNASWGDDGYSVNDKIWAEGWILQDEIGDPIRSVNISATGDYGTISGFDFSLRNNIQDGGADALWKWVRDNGIYFTNRVIKLYIVIDDVFYSIWSGVIQNNPVEEISYQFKCIDSFQKIHKVIPPNVVDRNVFINSDDESQGKSIPVCIGDIAYSKVLTITNKPSEKVLVYSRPLPPGLVEGKAAAAVEYDTHTILPGDIGPTPRLKLYTKEQTFNQNALVDKFLYVARGGGFSDVDMLNRIVRSDATDGNGFTWVYLESPFEFVDEATFNARYSYDPYYKEDKVKHYPQLDVEYQCWTRRLFEPGTSRYEAPGVTENHQYPPTPVPLEDSNWIKFTGVNCLNGGVGCNLVNLDIVIEPLWDCKVTIRKDSYDGEILGSKDFLFTEPIQNGTMNNRIAIWQSIPITRLYDDNVTLVVQVTGGILYRNYYTWINQRVQNSIFYRPPTCQLYALSVNGAESSEDTWWFSIVEMDGTHLISNNAITEIVTDNGKPSGQPLLYIYNKDRKIMEPVPNNIYKIKTQPDEYSGHPEFILYSSNIKKDGEVSYLATIMPQRWAVEIESDMQYVSRNKMWSVVQQGHIEAGGVSVPMINHLFRDVHPEADICNRNQTQYIQMRYPDFLDFKNTYSFTVKLEYPKEYLDYDVEEVYIGIDADYMSLPVTPSVTPVPIRIVIFVDVLDVYGNVVNSTQYEELDNDNTGDIVWPTDEIPVGTTISLNTLPSSYYDNGGIREQSYKTQWSYVGKDSSDEDVTLRSMLKLKSELWDAIKDGTSSNIIQMRVIVTSNGATFEDGAPFYLYVNLKECGIMGIRTTNPLNDEYYCRLKGEYLGPEGFKEETNTVYKAFKLILEQYDGIHYLNINYTNLPIVRDDWSVGRQLTERKSSFEYLKELAQHSFVSIYPMRNGNRALKAWREDTDLVKSFDSSTIIRGSIKDWEKTDVTDLYNDFRIWYNWSPAASTYIDSITLTNTNMYYPIQIGVTGAEAGFPGATMMCDYPNDLELWKTYVGGISPNSYTDAKVMWDYAHESYDIAGAVQPLPKNLSEMPWYINTKQFKNEEFSGASKSDSPFKYLQNLSEWCTLQKDQVKFNVPLTYDNVRLELLDYVSFADTIYTNNEVRYGWITVVEFVPIKNYMRLTVVLKPDPVVVDRVIRERGQLLNFSIYQESGSATGIFIDGQGRI